MSEKEENAALEKFKKSRKKYPNKNQQMLAKAMQEADNSSSPQHSQMVAYTGADSIDTADNDGS